MEFRIADTFTDSLARLTGEEQKSVKTAAFDLQLNPAHPSLQLHKLDRAKDLNFWSMRVSRDIRLIVHRTNASLLLCYVAHHDAAYQWAERRKLETHPKTGAAQLVEIRERVQEISVPKYVDVPTLPVVKPLLFANVADADLLQYGIPVEWLPDVRGANEDTLLEIATHLPGEAAEALLNLATGVAPVASPLVAVTDPFEHPDAQRRFRVMKNIEELQLALDYPWEKWAVFLHPAQRQLVAKDFKGPAKVAGSAGTGKTIVALHRAVHLARANPDSRVLLTTFSDTLANALRTRLRLLIGTQPRLGEQIEVLSMKAVGLRLYDLNLGKAKLISVDRLRRMMQESSDAVGDHKFNLRFLMSEWEQVVDAWQLSSWEDYRDVTRLGRKTRLKEAQRAMLWSIFNAVRTGLFDDGSMTEARMFERLAAHYKSGATSPFDFAVVDEAQDVSITQLRFLSSLGGRRSNGLFFAGDTGQRIFQQPFSWKGLGVDLRGRSTTLKVNYRTSHQIRMQADRLLDAEIADVDGNIEDRAGTVSLFDGPLPQMLNAKTEAMEQQDVAKWLQKRVLDGLRPDEIVLFVRSAAELPRAELAAMAAGLSFRVLDTHAETTVGSVSLSTMHMAKGLEFRAVAIMACDDEVIPLQQRIETATDASELEDVYNTERQLLYVACTRARDCLLLTSAGSPSEFLKDMQAGKVLRT
jgi:superfamily I DNA/RNA helicase/mRNA-degrading endonuclease RelE of RelBE toxin-antitoxin system